MRKVVIVTALTFALVLAGTGCGSSGGDKKARSEATSSSSDTVAVDTWAVSFCGAFLGWTKDINQLGSSVGAQLNSGSLQDRKDAILGLFDSASKETASLIKEIDAAGTPDIKNGAGLVSDLHGKFQDFDDAIQSARTEAKDLPVDDATAFKTQVDAMVNTYQKAATAVGDSFAELDAKYRSQPLDDAISANCRLS